MNAKKKTMIQTCIVFNSPPKPLKNTPITSKTAPNMTMTLKKLYTPLWSYHAGIISNQDSKRYYDSLSKRVLKKIQDIGNLSIFQKGTGEKIEPPRFVACYSLPFDDTKAKHLAKLRKLSASEQRAEDRQHAIGYMCPKELIQLHAIANKFLQDNFGNKDWARNTVFRKALVNYYRDGQDHISIHSDKEVASSIVLSMSFYPTNDPSKQRTLRILAKESKLGAVASDSKAKGNVNNGASFNKSKAANSGNATGGSKARDNSGSNGSKISGDEKVIILDNISMEQGSIVLMHQYMQQYFLHQVPKEPDVHTGRINVTFREY